MGVVIRITNWKAGESGSDLCLVEANCQTRSAANHLLEYQEPETSYLVVSMSGLTADHSPPSSAEG